MDLMGETVKELYEENDWGLCQWFANVKKCSECCEQLKKANLCDLARSVDWNVISKGKRPAERVR